MKINSLVWRSLVGVAGMGFILGTAVGAEKKLESKIKVKDSTQSRWNDAAVEPKKNRVILVEVTGSRIPQRVVIKGQQVNSGSPLYVVQGKELLRTGATSVIGILSLDPSITVGPRRH